MDKEISLTLNVALGLTSSVLCLLITRFKPWLLLVVVPITAFYFFALVSEIQDPFVGKAILQEAGNIYIYSSYGLPLLIVASILSGFWWRLKSK